MFKFESTSDEEDADYEVVPDVSAGNTASKPLDATSVELKQILQRKEQVVTFSNIT